MVKKSTKSPRKPRTGGQKSTNARKRSTTSTKKGEAKKGQEKEKRNSPAIIGGESNTFTTIKKKHRMLENLVASRGIVSPAALATGINRTTHYNWMASDPGYKQEVEQINEMAFDYVESRMLDRIAEGSDTMLIWYSKTKMKHRGFVEKTEIEVSEKPAFLVSPDQKGIAKTMDVIHRKTGTNDK